MSHPLASPTSMHADDAVDDDLYSLLSSALCIGLVGGKLVLLAP